MILPTILLWGGGGCNNIFDSVLHVKMYTCISKDVVFSIVVYKLNLVISDIVDLPDNYCLSNDNSEQLSNYLCHYHIMPKYDEIAFTCKCMFGVYVY